jgi:hypothetical protein
VVTPVFCVPEATGSNLGRAQTILTEMSIRFSQSFELNFGRTSQMRLLTTISFQIHSLNRAMIRHYIESAIHPPPICLHGVLLN